MRRAELLAALSVIAGAVAMACSMDTTDNGCHMPAPGVIIAAPGIDVQVRDPFGRGQAIGTTVVVRASDNSTRPYTVEDTLHIFSAFNTAGTYQITVDRPYYKEATIAKVVVTPNGCAVNETIAPVTLQLAAGAPPLRALVLLGADFLAQPGATVHLVPHFDADPSVSTDVTWKVNNTALATVDANGVVTAKCSTAGGTVTVTATAVADGVTSASVNLGVAPAVCP